MRLLFDVLHPAHVHFFRPLATQVIRDGGEVWFAARDKDVTVELLTSAGLPHRVLSTIGGGAVGLAGELVSRTARLTTMCRETRPQALLGIMGPCIAPVGRLLGIPSLVCYDTETATATNPWVFPLATMVATPRSFRGRGWRNQRRYDGYQELAYLHPRRFVADPARLLAWGVEPPFALVRFVSFEASHDAGDRGFDDRLAFVEKLARRLPVWISSERPLPADLRPLELPVPPEDLHHVLAAASLVVGEGATTAVEAAVLGTPAIFVHTARLGYIDEIESRFQLLFRRTSPRAVRRLALDLVDDPEHTAAVWQRRRSRMLESCVDVTDWLHRRTEELVAHRPG